jgi:hypothetical protein
MRRPAGCWESNGSRSTTSGAETSSAAPTRDFPAAAGNTIHCKSRTIRNLVLDTHATGRSFERVPACQDIQLPDEVKTLNIAVSTEKVGDFVLLRIDDMEDAVQVRLRFGDSERTTTQETDASSDSRAEG